MNPTTTYPKVRLMLLNLAWASARRHPFPSVEESFEEALSLAHVAFMEACKTYDPKRASFNTHCWTRVWCKLKSGEMRSSKRASMIAFSLDEEQHDDETAPRDKLTAPQPRRFSLEELTRDLGQDAQDIVMMLLETPEELLDETTLKPRAILRRIREHFSAKWQSEERMRRAVRELRAQVAWQSNRI